MKDRELLVTLLTSGRLTSTQTEGLQAELARLDYGFSDTIAPRVRAHAEAIARARGLMPAEQPKRADRSKKNEWHRHDDPYCAKRTPGTEYAETILQLRPTAPPQKRSA
jgi:hypothetical protein